MADWNEKAAKWAAENKERATELAHDAWESEGLDIFEWIYDLEIGWEEAANFGSATVAADQLGDFNLEVDDIDRLRYSEVGGWDSTMNLAGMRELYDAVCGLDYNFSGAAGYLASDFEAQARDALGEATVEFWNDYADALDGAARKAVAEGFEAAADAERKRAFIDAAMAIAASAGMEQEAAAAAAEGAYSAWVATTQAKRGEAGC